MKIKINILNKNIDITPVRQHYNDAGADIFSTEEIFLEPLETKKIPLGFSLELPDGFMGCIFPRSSLACNGIISQLPPIDSGYTGEIHIIITNISQKTISISKNTRVGQLVIIPIIYGDFVTELGTERKDCKFGSTGM